MHEDVLIEPVNDDSLIDDKRSEWQGWLSTIVAIAALITSITSIWLALRNAGSMDKLVQANSWPHLQVTSGNLDDEGSWALNFQITNAGAGPAKLHQMDMLWNGELLTHPGELLDSCCVDIEGEAMIQSVTNFTQGRVLRPGESIQFLYIPFDEGYTKTFERLNTARFSQLSFAGCYCSVFDECWNSDFDGLDKTEVSSCKLTSPSVTAHK